MDWLQYLPYLGWVILLFIAGHLWLGRRVSNNQLEEYKALFDVSESDNKELNSKIESFLLTINSKDIQVERATAVGERLADRVAEGSTLIGTQNGVIEGLKVTLEYEQEQYAKLIGQKKSSETRLGQISEQLAPFLSDFPFDPKRAKFLGDPIDLIVFSDDKITFVEVKSGKSQLSKKQRRIRDMVKAGKVDFLLYRIKGE